MRRITVGLLAGVALGAISLGSAAAADLRPAYKAPPVVAPAFSWTGLYIGAHGGCGSIDHKPAVGVVDGDAPDPGTSFGFSDNSRGGGCFGGGQIGFNWQFSGPWVLGVEADIAGGSLRSSGTHNEFEAGGVTEPLATYTSELQSFGTVRARLGWSWTWGSTPVMPYITGGWAWGRNRLAVTNVDAGVPSAFSDTQTHNGWTVGAGAEIAFTPNWSVKGEYLYLDLGRKSYNVITFDDVLANPSSAFSLHPTVHTVKVGLNYRFGWWR